MNIVLILSLYRHVDHKKGKKSGARIFQLTLVWGKVFRERVLRVHDLAVILLYTLLHCIGYCLKQLFEMSLKKGLLSHRHGCLATS